MKLKIQAFVEKTPGSKLKFVFNHLHEEIKK